MAAVYRVAGAAATPTNDDESLRKEEGTAAGCSRGGAVIPTNPAVPETAAHPGGSRMSRVPADENETAPETKFRQIRFGYRLFSNFVPCYPLCGWVV